MSQLLHHGEAVDRLREPVNLIGIDGIRMMEHTHKIPVNHDTLAIFIIWRFVNFIILEVLTYYHHQKTI